MFTCLQVSETVLRMSKKRTASTPQGGVDKDSRLTTSNSFGVLEDSEDRAEGWEQINRTGGRGQSRGQRGRGSPQAPQTSNNTQENARTYSEALQRRHSTASQGSHSGGRPSNMGDRTKFVTPKPEGGMRDDIVIECQTINGKPFKGTVTYKEAKLEIFEGKLGYEQGLLHSI